ncbi:hypothetical protein M422DRAFT_267272 [Sphaerobolus stellatus SS14]|uniref:Uncharacterized protein n=1 Tax=Sphaerobolus stellatus (strain SS14) TaxID=990650 RepID=A0A0C9TM72_SPHS4|nr:hypothetical protein M422DRAFT_267272 [Sphaerobolus stellatus SS14]
MPKGQARKLIPKYIGPYKSLKKVSALYKLGGNDEQEWFINKIIGHHWTNNAKIDFQVKWMLGDITWDLLHECNKLEARERYLKIHGINNPVRF